MGKLSKDKGKRGEREFAAFCGKHGYEARRTAQYCGKTEESADVVGLPGMHVEVKRTEALRLYDALDQARRDAKEGIPMVAHRKNNHRWVVILDADDFFTIYREWEASRDEHTCGL